jgi:hypothetical protein
MKIKTVIRLDIVHAAHSGFPALPVHRGVIGRIPARLGATSELRSDD